jgi:hypothetical protein
MLRSEAVAEVQMGLGFTTAKTTEIILALKNAQVNLELRPFLPWFLKSVETDIATVANTSTVAVPTGFIREFEGDAFYRYVAADDATDEDEDISIYPGWKPLAKGLDEDFHKDYPGTGVPKAYSVDATNFRLYPTPDAVYALKIIYYKQAAILATDVENDWLKYAPDLLIGEAGQRLAAGLRDAGAKNYFLELAAKGSAQLQQGGEAREHANQRYVMGGPD